MDILMIILRLFHIFGGILWVGVNLFMWWYFLPAAAASGAAGTRYFQKLFSATRFGAIGGIGSFSTTLSGLWLYYRVSDGFNADWMRSDSGIVLSIGAVAGLLAFGHGGAAFGPLGSRYETLAKEVGDKDITPEQEAEFQALNAKFRTHTRIGGILTIIAVFGMASARYF